MQQSCLKIDHSCLWCDDPGGKAHFLGKVIRVSGIITQTYPFCICLSEISEIICRGSVLASREVIWGIISQLLKYRAGVTIVRLRSPLSQSAFDSIISPSATLVKSFTIRASAQPKCVSKYSVYIARVFVRGGIYKTLPQVLPKVGTNRRSVHPDHRPLQSQSPPVLVSDPIRAPRRCIPTCRWDTVSLWDDETLVSHRDGHAEIWNTGGLSKGLTRASGNSQLNSIHKFQDM